MVSTCKYNLKGKNFRKILSAINYALRMILVRTEMYLHHSKCKNRNLLIIYLYQGVEAGFTYNI